MLLSNQKGSSLTPPLLESKIKKHQKSLPVIHSYGHPNSPDVSRKHNGTDFRSGQVKGFENSSHRRGNRKLWTGTYLDRPLPEVPLHSSTDGTSPNSPTLSTPATDQTCNAAITTDCRDASSFSLIKQTKKRMSMKMCKYCNWVLNVLHQLQMSQDRIFFLAHSLLLETLHFPPQKKKNTHYEKRVLLLKKVNSKTHTCPQRTEVKEHLQNRTHLF